MYIALCYRPCKPMSLNIQNFLRLLKQEIVDLKKKKKISWEKKFTGAKRLCRVFKFHSSFHPKHPWEKNVYIYRYLFSFQPILSIPLLLPPILPARAICATLRLQTPMKPVSLAWGAPIQSNPIQKKQKKQKKKKQKRQAKDCSKVSKNVLVSQGENKKGKNQKRQAKISSKVSNNVLISQGEEKKGKKPEETSNG